MWQMYSNCMHVCLFLFVCRTLKPRTDVVVVQPWCDWRSPPSSHFNLWYSMATRLLSFQSQQLLGPNHAGQGLELKSKIPKAISPQSEPCLSVNHPAFLRMDIILQEHVEPGQIEVKQFPLELPRCKQIWLVYLIGLLIQCKFGVRTPVCIFSSMLNKLSKVCESALLKALDMKHTVRRRTVIWSNNESINRCDTNNIEQY